MEDIKGTFESQFEMDLETFGRQEEQAFNNSDFGMTNTFHLSSLDELSKDSFVSQPPTIGGVTSGSSDAMFGGASSSNDLRGYVPHWQEKDNTMEEKHVATANNRMNALSDHETVYHSQGQNTLGFSRENSNLSFRSHEDLFSDHQPEDLTFPSREPEDLSFNPTQPENLSFNHSEPQDLTFSRPSEDLSFTQPEDLTFGHRPSESLGAAGTSDQFSAPSFLSAGTISQDQFLNMFDQD